MSSQSSSPAVQAPRKRPAKMILSDDEDDIDQLGSTSALPNGKGKGKESAQRKRVRSRSSSPMSSSGGSDFDILGSDDGEREAPARRKKGKEKANGFGHGNGNGHVGDSDEDGDSEAGPSVPRGEVGFRPEYKRGKDGYVAGSIVRIKLINFMTYDQVEFRPGPHLNMILGPNGTGKSTIAASIAIGLGFPPKIMGRAPDLKAYVKQGCEEAQTEVELKAFPGKKNPVIWRSFTKENEKSEWRLNGTKSTKQAIAEVVAEFGVQANNLCCFLAQDKVAEFAKMDGTVVLKETMRAAGDPRLSAWHEKLMELGAARKTIEAELESKTAERDTLQRKVNNLAPDVRHFEERAGLKIQVKVLQCLVIAAQRYGRLGDLASQKEDLSKHKRQKNRLLEEARPTQDLRQLYTTKVDKAAARVNEADKAVREADRKLKTTWQRLTNKEEAVQSIATSLANIKKEMKRDTDLRTNFQKQIRDAQAILDQPVEDVTAQLDQIDIEKRRIAGQIHTAKKAVQELSAKHRQSEIQLSAWNKELQAKTEEHTKLNSIQTQKEQAACNFDPSITYVLEWLRQHENEFEEAICKPPMISVNIRDARYAWQVESCTGVGDRSTFICQTRNDYARLLALNKHQHPGYQYQKRDGSMGYYPPGRVKLYITQVTVNEETCNPKRACSSEQLQALGFEGWASDYVDADAPVMAFLNTRCNLATTALTLRRSDQIRHDSVLAARITNYVTASEIVKVTYSRYGNKDPVTKADPPKKAVAFNLAVNTEKVNELVEEMTVLKRNKRDIEAPLESERIEKERAEEKVGELQDKHANLKKEESKLREGNLARIRAGENLQRAQQDLARLGNIDYNQKRANLQAKQKNNLADRVTIVKDMNAVEEGYIDLTTVAAKRTLELYQFTEDLKVIDSRIEGSETALKELDEAIGQLQVVTAKTKADIDGLVTLLRDQLATLGTDQHLATDQFEDIAPSVPDRRPTKTVEELQDEVADMRARLDLTEGIDEAVVTKYRKLKAGLESLVATTEQQTRNVNTVKSKIQKILDQFDPALNTLVGVVNKKFSAAFEFVGCAGEIQVNRPDEGFDKWGIDILVSYRDGDKLDKLTGTRQSGGERSLATITYLMSLSSMARTPFSLVDEINQGMDQRAERNVHNQLVDVTCAQEAGQYFLITPKLLTDLTYHRKMKILNVNNGSWLPAPKPSSGRALKWSDFKGCLSNYRASKGIAVSA